MNKLHRFLYVVDLSFLFVILSLGSTAYAADTYTYITNGLDCGTPAQREDISNKGIDFTDSNFGMQSNNEMKVTGINGADRTGFDTCGQKCNALGDNCTGFSINSSQTTCYLKLIKSGQCLLTQESALYGFQDDRKNTWVFYQKNREGWENTYSQSDYKMTCVNDTLHRGNTAYLSNLSMGLDSCKEKCLRDSICTGIYTINNNNKCNLMKNAYKTDQPLPISGWTSCYKESVAVADENSGSVAGERCPCLGDNMPDITGLQFGAYPDSNFCQQDDDGLVFSMLKLLDNSDLMMSTKVLEFTFDTRNSTGYCNFTDWNDSSSQISNSNGITSKEDYNACVRWAAESLNKDLSNCLLK